MQTEAPIFSAVLFDMDGTLVDSEPLWLSAETELMGRYGFSWSPIQQAQCLGGPLDRVGRYMNSLVNDVESGAFFTEELIRMMAIRLKSGAPLMPGAEELIGLLTRLKVPMALVSASPRVLVDAILQNFPTHPFQISISCDDVELVKPNPDGYLKAANIIGVAIEDCLILEDSATGVEAGSRSGGCVVAIPHLVPIAESERVETITSLEELSELVLRDLHAQWNFKKRTRGRSL